MPQKHRAPHRKQDPLQIQQPWSQRHDHDAVHVQPSRHYCAMPWMPCGGSLETVQVSFHLVKLQTWQGNRPMHDKDSQWKLTATAYLLPRRLRGLVASRALSLLMRSCNKSRASSDLLLILKASFRRRCLLKPEDDCCSSRLADGCLEFAGE